MFGRLWFTLFLVLGMHYDPSTVWLPFLKGRDNTLPWTSIQNDMICYYFRLDQSCSATAIKDLLALAAIPSLTAYTLTGTECDQLQEGMEPVAAQVANVVFTNAITTAAAAGVTNFELLTQTWVLQVGHVPLTTDATYVAFVAALNSVTDWTKVQCNAGNLRYGSNTVTLPDFVADPHDCNILSALYVAPFDCNGSCVTEADAQYCCKTAFGSQCCSEARGIGCGANGCTPTPATVCSLKCEDSGCNGADQATLCDATNSNCPFGAILQACTNDVSSPCCQANLPTLCQDSSCQVKPTCCNISSNSNCCLGN